MPPSTIGVALCKIPKQVEEHFRFLYQMEQLHLLPAQET
jgi:hypothetical protein